MKRPIQFDPAWGMNSAGRGPADLNLGIKEAKALGFADFILRPEEVEIASMRSNARKFAALRTTDGLRLPPPPEASRSYGELAQRLAVGRGLLDRAGQDARRSPREREAAARLGFLLDAYLGLSSAIDGARSKNRV